MRDAVLAERFEAVRVSRLDIVAFLSAFLGGLALYALLRAFNASQFIITLSIISVMIVYAVTVAKVPRLRVRLDQAGDNAYYLGLLFTLASMAVALYEFGVSQFGTPGVSADESGAKQIISNFGLALGTTITGIFLRVLLHQMRVDPADVESMSRIELAEAATRLRSILDLTSVEMAKLLDQLRQRTSDQLGHLVEEVRNTLIAYNADVSAATTRLTESANVAHVGAIAQVSEVTKHLVDVAAQAEAAFERLRAVEPPPLTLARRLGTISTTLEKVAIDVDNVGQRLAEVAGVAGSVGEALGGASARLIEANEVAQRRDEVTLRRLEESSAGVNRALERIGETLEEERQRFATLEVQTRSSTEAALESQKAADEVLSRLVSVAKRLTEVINRKE